MGFWNKIVKATINTLQLPVAIVKDVATLGGSILGNERTYTGKKVEDIGEAIEEAKDAL